MKSVVVNRSRTLAIQWHRSAGHESLTVADEAHESLLLEDGSWLQATRDAPSRPGQIPARFLHERLSWLQFLKSRSIGDFQLRYQRRRVYLIGPPPRFHYLKPEWTIYLAVPSRQPGVWHFAYSCRNLHPPTSELMWHLRALIDMPALTPEVGLPGPVIFSGDHLLRFLESAIDHVLEVPGKVGSWVERCPRHLPATPHAEALLPLDRWFLPATSGTLPRPAWRALAYDASRDLLLVVSSLGRQYRAVRLAAPLYRSFKGLLFVPAMSSVLIKDVCYHMPTAVLMP